MTSPFKITPLNYPNCVRQWFEPLAHLPGATWFDSSGHERGRFDVFSAYPVLTLERSQRLYQIDGPLLSQKLQAIVQKHQALEHTQPKHQQTQAKQAFNLTFELRNSLYGPSDRIKQQTQSLSPEQQRWLPGVMGMLSYSLGAVDQSVRQRSEENIDWPEMSLGFYAWVMVIDHQQAKAWLTVYQPLFKALELDESTLLDLIVSGPKNLETSPFSQPKKNLSFNTQTKDTPNQQTQRLNFLKIFHAAKADTHYKAQFEKVQDYLRAGDCYQINLARRIQLPYEGDPFTLYCQIREHTLAPYSGFVQTQTGACLCFSPEHFLTLDTQGAIRTSPIKGTRPRSQDPQEDQIIKQQLAQAQKDRAENLMIVDLLRNDLGRVSQPGSVSVPKLMCVETFTTVHHLVSEIVSQIRPDVCAEALLSACFPGGSITGAPKIRAMQIIDELESHARHIFCGSLCYIGPNNTLEANICIRTALVQSGFFTLWAGGGIVVDSEVEDEWSETKWKIQKILSAFSKLE